jgi:fumarate hydratase subunit alpha
LSADFFDLVKEAIIRANTVLPEPVLQLIERAIEAEEDIKARKRLEILLENARIAREKKRPICQDTGLLNVFLFLPEGSKLPLGFQHLLDRAVFEAYREGGFRFSTVNPPLLDRNNLGTNKPAFLKIIPVKEARVVKLVFMPKGAGSENASFILMLKPTTPYEEVVEQVAQTIIKKASSSCPPIIVGVSAGGTFDSAALKAKLSLLETGVYLSDFGLEILEAVNKSGIGPFGLGGSTTALWINTAFEPTHIASLPVAVSMSCHALRYAELEFDPQEWNTLEFEVV